MRVALLLWFLIYSAYGRRPIEDQTQEDNDISNGDAKKSGLKHMRFRRSPPKDDDIVNSADARTQKIPVNIVAKEGLKSDEKEGGFWSKVKAHVVGLYEGVKESMGKVVDGISTLWKDNSTPGQKVDLTSKHVRRRKSIQNNDYKLPERVTPPWSAQGHPSEEPFKQRTGAHWRQRIEPSEPEPEETTMEEEPIEEHTGAHGKLRTEPPEPEEATVEEASIHEFTEEGAEVTSESTEDVTTESETTGGSLDVITAITKAPWSQKSTEKQNSAHVKNHPHVTKSLSSSLKSLGPLRKQNITTKTPSTSGSSTQNKYSTHGPQNHLIFKKLKEKMKGTTKLLHDEHEIAPWAKEYQPYLRRYHQAMKKKNKMKKGEESRK
ncbi:hypothetical protein Aduo_013439 [Ancylostoma duodenale]